MGKKKKIPLLTGTSERQRVKPGAENPKLFSLFIGFYNKNCIFQSQSGPRLGNINSFFIMGQNILYLNQCCNELLMSAQ